MHGRLAYTQYVVFTLLINKVLDLLQFLYSQKHTHTAYTTRNSTNTHLKKQHTQYAVRDQQKHHIYQSQQINHKSTINTTHTTHPRPTKTTNNKPPHKEQHHTNTFPTYHKPYTTTYHNYNITIIITLILISWLSPIPITQQAHLPITPTLHPTINIILQPDPLSPNMRHIIHPHYKITHTYTITHTTYLKIHTLAHHINLHNTPTHSIKVTLTISPIITIMHIGHMYYITHMHHKNPKLNVLAYYAWNNSILLLQHGDIELNPGPSLTSIHTLPQTYLQSPTHTYTHPYIHQVILASPNKLT